ncbi:hypothetical protein TSAR_001233 [Trichomalopsis sarcophagae]|uniref:Uncharacterized protein n=1 Tax=Trichomalopsis sarcophagae TaxID=543379 RepID=A0A232FGY8_9HYME|nr:hypothetical protein TSAR_001233 [Trichomalopsis sarcophagae]
MEGSVVLQSTLRRKVSILNKNPSADKDNVLKVALTCTFTEEEEDAFSREITKMENRLIPLTSIDMRKVAFQCAEKLQIPHYFNKDTELAGRH